MYFYLRNVVGNTELIDTCWDVNTCVFNDAKQIFDRINRYMLGCKYVCICLECLVFKELIDTCWDVNSLRLFASIYRGLRINKYILKYKYQKIEYKL